MLLASVLSVDCSELSALPRPVSPASCACSCVVWLLICCAGPACLALTNAVMMALTSSPEPMPAELSRPAPVLLLLPELPLVALAEVVVVPTPEMEVMGYSFRDPIPFDGDARTTGKTHASRMGFA